MEANTIAHVKAFIAGMRASVPNPNSTEFIKGYFEGLANIEEVMHISEGRNEAIKILEQEELQEDLQKLIN